MTSLSAFISELRRDATSVHHQEIRWITETFAHVGEHQVNFENLIVGYIAVRDGQPKLIELRQLCGCVTGDRRTEEIRAEEQSAATIGALESVAIECRLTLRHGQFTLDPSPLIPRKQDVLRTFCPTFMSLAGTTYRAWTDGWGVGLECVRSDGLCSYLYVEPAQERQDGGRVFSHLGTGGDPTEDVLQHVYDPFDPVQLTRVYTVVTANGERNWTAEDSGHACKQHEEAFGSEAGETIEDVYLTRTARQAVAAGAV